MTSDIILIKIAIGIIEKQKSDYKELKVFWKNLIDSLEKNKELEDLKDLIYQYSYQLGKIMAESEIVYNILTHLQKEEANVDAPNT